MIEVGNVVWCAFGFCNANRDGVECSWMLMIDGSLADGCCSHPIGSIMVVDEEVAE